VVGGRLGGRRDASRLVVALIAAVFGFGGIAAGAAGISKVVFVMFLIGAVVSFLIHGRGRL
jgi:uncharacterized membrane protein YtjA (UPF0391 family)